MTRATIIFSDGSKRMAHNNDDLSLRWHERKSYQYEQNPPPDRAYIRDCSDIPNFEIGYIWKAEIIEQLFSAQNQLAFLKKQYSTKRQYDDDRYVMQWKTISSQCHIEIQKIKLYLSNDPTPPTVNKSEVDKLKTHIDGLTERHQKKRDKIQKHADRMKKDREFFKNMALYLYNLLPDDKQSQISFDYLERITAILNGKKKDQSHD